MKRHENGTTNQNTPDCFYIVDELITTFGHGPGKSKPKSKRKFFKGDNLPECKARALEYYHTRELEILNEKHPLPIAGPSDFVMGENSAYFLTLSLVVCEKDGSEIIHTLIGEDAVTEAASQEIEEMVLSER